MESQLKSIPYLIQTGNMRTSPKDGALERISSIVELEYMGSAEFEFGALPDSIRRMQQNQTMNSIFETPDGIFCIYGDTTRKGAIIKAVENLYDMKLRTKEYTWLQELKKGEEHVNFWWDIDNDFLFWIMKREPSTFTDNLSEIIQNFPSKN